MPGENRLHLRFLQRHDLLGKPRYRNGQPVQRQRRSRRLQQRLHSVGQLDARLLLQDARPLRGGRIALAHPEGSHQLITVHLRRTAGCALAAGLAVLLSACGSSASVLKPVQLPPVHPTNVSDAHRATRQITEFLPSVNTALALVEAERAYTSHCLGKRVYRLPREQVRAFLTAELSLETTGALLWGNAPGVAHVAPNLSGGPLPEGVGEAAYSDCQDKASALFGGRGLAAVFIVSSEALPGRGPTSALQDPRARKVVGDWTSCATPHLKGRSPLAAFLDLGTDTSSVAYTCKLKVNAIGRLLALQRAYDDRYLTRSKSFLHEREVKIRAFIKEWTDVDVSEVQSG